ncbi:hypothetical protein ABZ477_04760 [Microbacterium sp. NPDC019599]|uniref:hypothetical protein n=1 Tax=Microbacterium sp. NPDC019599 TaxID=3154690 RepID=UPI0033DDCDA4
MNGDKVQGQVFQELVNEYFPRDAVQVLEDVRVARQHVTPIADQETNLLLGSLSGQFAR